MPGIADDTLFTMTCADWIEWNVTTQNFKYEYRVASYGSDRYARIPHNIVWKLRVCAKTKQLCKNVTGTRNRLLDVTSLLGTN